MWTSAAVAQVLQGSMCCMCLYVHTLVITCYAHAVTAAFLGAQSRLPSLPLTSCIKASLLSLLDLSSFLAHCLYTLNMVYANIWESVVCQLNSICKLTNLQTVILFCTYCIRSLTQPCGVPLRCPLSALLSRLGSLGMHRLISSLSVWPNDQRLMKVSLVVLM